MSEWLQQIGGVGYPDAISAAAALVILALAAAAAMVAGKRLGPRLAQIWEHRAGAAGEPVTARMCALVRHAVAALLLAIVLQLDEWRPLSAFLLGFGLAVATALLIRGIVRSLQLPRWTALLLAAVAFVAIIARSLDGLGPMLELIDQIGFDMGSTRISLLTLIQIAVTLLVLLAAVRLLSRLANRSIQRSKGLDATQQLLAQKLVGIVLLVAAFFIGIDIAGIDLTALAVFSGAMGLAVGFGLQKTFGNLFAGIILLMDRSIKPGDVIAVGESFGHVNKIGVRAVSIITRDGKEHLIPNENLMTQEVENWSYSSPNVRLHVTVGVAYDCDLPLAIRLLTEAAKKPARVLATPAPVVWVKAFGDSSIELDIRVWIADPAAGIGSVRSEILSRVWELFRENRISIPFPQRDIHIRDWQRNDPTQGPAAAS